MDILHLREDSPSRSPDWRWQKVQIIAQSQNRRIAAKLRSTGDEFTARGAAFLQEWSSCQDAYDQLCAMEKWLHLWQAYDIYEGNHKLLKCELEARLLTNDTNEGIAKRLSLHPDVIDWYEALFFNVLDRLDNPGWIANKVLGEQMHYGLTERDYNFLWKFYGYVGGNVLLDALIYRHFSPMRPTEPGQLRAFTHDDHRDVLSLKALTAVRTMPVNSYTQQIIIELTQRYRELELAADKGGGANDMMLANMKAALEALPWTVGDSPDIISSKDPELVIGQLSQEVQDYDKMAGELRADQFLEITTGLRLERMKRARFPEIKQEPVTLLTDVKSPE
jgi:hypothetical protein